MKYWRICSVLLCLGVLFACTKKSEDGSNSLGNSANLLAVGQSAQDILSNEKFTKLKIEIAYVTGFQPTQIATNSFISYLKIYTFKEDIEMVFTELPSPDEESLTLQEIADLENENRTVYNDGETLGIYIYFTDAPFETDEAEGVATLGAVYRNTSMVIYETTVRRIADRNIIRDGVVEAATIKHEFGHLLGLVNFGTPPVNDHEDSESKNHCNVPECLMGAEIQFSRIGKSSNLLSTNEPKTGCSLTAKSVLKMLENNTSKGVVNAITLDTECILDLKSNGGR